MKSPYRVEVKVIQQKGRCEFGHKVGDLIKFDADGGMSGKICWSSLCSMMYKVHGFLYGCRYPWQDDTNKDIGSHPCPDTQNPVIYEIRRFRI